MKQFNQKIAATLNAILALMLVGFAPDQAIAKAKAKKSSKARAGGVARIATKPGSPDNAGKVHFNVFFQKFASKHPHRLPKNRPRKHPMPVPGN